MRMIPCSLLFCTLTTFASQTQARLVYSSRCQLYYNYSIPIVDLTADIILTKLENLVEWVCLIQFLTKTLKNCFPAPSYPLLCSFNDRVEQKISEQDSQRNLSSSSGLCPSDQRNKVLNLQKTPVPQHLSVRADHSHPAS